MSRIGYGCRWNELQGPVKRSQFKIDIIGQLWKKIEIRLFSLCHFNIYNVVVKLFFANAKLNKNNYRNKFFVKKANLKCEKRASDYSGWLFSLVLLIFYYWLFWSIFPRLFHFSIYLRILKNLNIWAYCHFCFETVRDIFSCGKFYSCLITLAGLPATTVLSSTSRVTIAPAATTAFSPTVTPGRIVAPAPIQQLRFRCTGLQVRMAWS